MTFPFVGTHTGEDWASWRRYNADVTDEGPALKAASLPAYVSPTALLPAFPSDLVVEDLDVDDCGDLYLLSAEGDVYRYDRPTRELRRLPCTFEDALVTPRGLRVTADTIYVADGGAPDRDDGRVLAVSRHLLQTRWIATDPFAAPVALVGEGETVLVLDAGPGSEAEPGDGEPVDRATFELYEDRAEEWRWRLVRGDEIIADSGEGYGSLRAAREDLDTVRRTVRDAREVELGSAPDPDETSTDESTTDEADEGEDGDEQATVEVYEDRAGEWRWRLVHRGEIIADSGEGYDSRDALAQDLDHVRRTAPTAWAVRPGTVADQVAGDDAGGFLATIDRDARVRPEVTGLASPADAAVDREGNRYVLAAVGDDPGTSGPAILRFDAPTVGARGPADGTDDGDGPAPDDATDDGTEPADTPNDGADDEDDRRPEPPPVDAGDGVVLVAPDDFGVPATGPFEPACIEADHVDEVLVGVTAEDDRALFRYRSGDGAFEGLDGFRGRASTLRLARDRETCEPETLYVVGGDGRPVTVLDARRAHLLNDDTGRYDARLVARLDAGIDGVQWHRVTTDLTDGSGTEVRVQYFATDDEGVAYERRPGIDPAAIDGIGPATAARLRAAGVDVLSELVEVDPATLARYASTTTYTVPERRAADWIATARELLADRADDDIEWRRLAADPRDALLEDAVGRYLWVRLDLIGTRFASPTVESFRAYFPRQSYLRYLPSIYREDEASAAFLERFLSIFESVFVDLEEEIEAAIRYLDPDGVPPEYLPWLGSWLALSADETWPATAHRELLRRAPELFRYRGTVAGLLATTRIFLGDRFGPSQPAAWYLARQRAAIEARREAGRLSEAAARRAIERLDPSPFVWERPDLSCIDDETVEAIYERLLPCSQCFALVVPPFVDEAAMETVERIVREQAPAHTAGRAIRLQPRIQLAGDEHDRANHTYLGVNSVLAERDFVVEESSLGTDSELVEREPDAQLGLRSRLGADTRIS